LGCGQKLRGAHQWLRLAQNEKVDIDLISTLGKRMIQLEGGRIISSSGPDIQ